MLCTFLFVTKRISHASQNGKRGETLRKKLHIPCIDKRVVSSIIIYMWGRLPPVEF